MSAEFIKDSSASAELLRICNIVYHNADIGSFT